MTRRLGDRVRMNRLSRRQLLRGMVVVGSVGLLHACGPSTPATAPTAAPKSPQPADPKTVRVAINARVLTFDAANHRDRNTETVIRNMFDGLYTQTPEGKPIPEMAEGVKQVDDKTWDFKIRKGITFHNGDPLTADDVVFTFDRLTREGAMEGKTSPRLSLIPTVKAVKKVDESTVRFELVAPVSETRMLYGVAYNQIIPKAHFQKVGVEEFIRRPVGTGPFKPVEAKLDERIVLERYDKYWGGSPTLAGTPGPAKVDRAIFLVITDPAARVAALRAGDVDIIQDVPQVQLSVLEGDANVQVRTIPGSLMHFLALNTKKPPFDDLKVRQAVAHAIDYQGIVKQLYGGRADVQAGQPFLTSLSEVVDPSLKQYEYSPDRAKALLQEAGKTGVSFVLDAGSGQETLAQAIAQMLGKVGVKAEVRQWEAAALAAATAQGDRTARVAVHGNASGNPLWANWIAGTGEPSNHFKYLNQEFDSLMKKAPTIVDPAERTATFQKAYGILYKELPSIALFTPQVVEAARKSVLNWTPSAVGRMNLHRVDLERK